MDSANNDKVLTYAPATVQPSYHARRVRLRVSGAVAVIGAAAYVVGMLLGPGREQLAAVALIGKCLFWPALVWYVVDLARGIWQENMR